MRIQACALRLSVASLLTLLACGKKGSRPTEPQLPTRPPTFESVWGGFGHGDGQFDTPWNTVTDAAGNVYVSDTINNRIQKFGASGAFLLTWTWTDAAPRDIECSSDGVIWVLEQRRIRKFSANGDSVGIVHFSTGTGPGQINSPAGLALEESGDVYIADFWNDRVTRLAANGALLTEWGSTGSGNGQFERPYGIAVDAAGNVYVSDMMNHRVQKFTATGTYVSQWGSLGSGPGQFKNPVGLAIDGSGVVYVADLLNSRVQAFSGDARFLLQFG